MKLFLASEAKHPDSFNKLENYIGGFKDKTIAFVPTAANGEGWGHWQNGGSWNVMKTIQAKVTLVQLEDYRDSSAIKEFENKDIIWFMGGVCGYLMYWIRRTQLDKHLHSLLNKSLYVGSSAGSMIASQNLDIVEWYPGESEHGASIIPGLGLIDFDIYPHYQEQQLEEIQNNYKGNKLYLLKNGEAIIVEDGKVQIFGEERVISGKP